MAKAEPASSVAELVPDPRSPAEEIVNSLTHGMGLALSILGGIALMVCALSHGDAWRIAGCSVFATTLIAVYAASTLSHSPFEPQRKQLFKRLDQGFIYLLIAGTYTPFSLAYLRTGWWWLFFALMWSLASCGCLTKILLSHRIKSVAVWSYVFLGWIPVFATGSLIERIPAGALWWMLIGGLCYTAGTPFLVFDQRFKRFHFHAIWHLFVIAGSTCNFIPVLLYVAFPGAEQS